MQNLLGNIDTKIEYVKENISTPNDLKKVIQLVKKRDTIRELHKNKCVGCKKKFLHDNLPALHFHRRDEKNNIQSSETSKKIKNYEYSHLKEWLQRKTVLHCVEIAIKCYILNNSKKVIKKLLMRNIQKR